MEASFGQARDFRCLQGMAKASQLRVSAWEAFSTGGLKVQLRAEKLRTAMRLGNFPGRLVLWPDWYKGSHLLVLDETMRTFDAMGHPTPSTI